MLVRKAVRYRVHPTPTQIDRLAQWDGALRFLFNLGNEQRRLGYARPKDERRYPTAFDQINELTELRAELPWLADVPRNVCAQLLVELDKAWQRCFKRLGKAPRWKRHGRDTLGFCEPHPKTWRLDGTLLRFPKLGNLRAIVHRPLEGKPKTRTLRREGSQWFARILCEIEIADPIARMTPVVAIDRGVVNAIATSDGELFESPRHYTKALRRLAHAQQNVSRKEKGSKNREKAKARVAALHRKVKRQREHFLHNITARIAKSHGICVVEKLQVVNMTASARGTVETPGHNVRQKAGLNRAILDSGWGIFLNQLRYKMLWSGGSVVEVPAAYSSQTCSACEHVHEDNRPSQAVFACGGCGYRDHADRNAAKVLLTRANRSGMPVDGDGAKRSRKRLRVARRPAESSGL